MCEHTDSTHETTPNHDSIATDGGVNVPDLSDRVQTAQNEIEKLEDDLPAHAYDALEAIEDDLEGIEDGIEDGEDFPSDIDDRVQQAQDDVTNLQQTLASADVDTRRKAENIEDAVEEIEDGVADHRSGFGVKVDTDPVEFFDTPTPTAVDVLERFGKNTDDVLVEKGTENTFFDDNEVDLSRPGIERFTSEPRTDGNS